MNKLEEGIIEVTALLREVNASEGANSTTSSVSYDEASQNFDLATEDLLSCLDRYRTGILDGSLSLPDTVFGSPTSELVSELTTLFREANAASEEKF